MCWEQRGHCTHVHTWLSDEGFGKSIMYNFIVLHVAIILATVDLYLSLAFRRICHCMYIILYILHTIAQ